MPSPLLPRGIRNNNPGNLRLTRTAWLGQKSSLICRDRDFAEFAAPLYGLRALMKTLLTYHLRHGLDTVDCIVNRFAPPHENDTGAYALAVAKALGVRRREKINLAKKPALAALARAIVLHENGRPPPGWPPGWYDPILYDQAARLALSSIT